MTKKKNDTHANANRNKKFHLHHGKKRHTAVIFD